MLEHLGHPGAAAALMAALESTLAAPDTRAGDLGGTATSEQVTEAVVARVRG